MGLSFSGIKLAATMSDFVPWPCTSFVLHRCSITLFLTGNSCTISWHFISHLLFYIVLFGGHFGNVYPDMQCDSSFQPRCDNLFQHLASFWSSVLLAANFRIVAFLEPPGGLLHSSILSQRWLHIIFDASGCTGALSPGHFMSLRQTLCVI